MVSDELKHRIEKAGELSWAHHPRRIVFYLPGMFHIDGKTGRYPAISVTGKECELQCKHCKGKLLKPMTPARTVDELMSLAHRWQKDGIKGVLLSGGSRLDGSVPLEPLLPYVSTLQDMGFFVSAHSGFATPKLARALKESGVDQVLIDVVGDDATVRNVLNIGDGIAAVRRSLDSLFGAGLTVVPHIIIGLGGEIDGEYRALEMLVQYPISILMFVVLMPTVAMGKKVSAPPMDDVLSVIVTGREAFPEVEQSLGCARPRGAYRWELERWALRAGINRMALWSDAAIDEAKRLGLETHFQYTCCSVPLGAV